MDWKRGKTLLIYLFLGVNLFLAAIVVYGAVSDARSERAALRDGARALRRRGVLLEEDLLSRVKTDERAFNLFNPLYDGAEFAERLLGARTEPAQTEAGARYQNAAGALTLEDGGFFFERDAPPQGEGLRRGEAEKTLEAGFSKLELGGYAVLSETENGGGYDFVLAPRFRERQIEGVTLEVSVRADEISAMRGVWLIPSEAADAAPLELRKKADIFMALLGDGDVNNGAERRVTEAAFGYWAPPEARRHKATLATPAYVLTVDGGKHVYDARTMRKLYGE
jgi:hypothetical protein